MLNYTRNIWKSLFTLRTLDRFYAPLPRFLKKNVGGILFGVVAGFLLANVSVPYQSQLGINNYTTISNGNHSLDDFTVANKLTNEVKVLCWIMTTEKNHQSKAIHVKNTWGSRCNKLLFMSNVQDSLLGSIGLNVSDGPDHLWGKTMRSFQYIYENYFNDFDWFMKADDDTYVVVENLRYMLYSYSANTPIYFGFKFQILKQIYNSGGAGYVLSKEALRRFVEVALTNKKICWPEVEGPEDVHIGYCLNMVNVTAVDTRDSSGRGRFFPFEPVAHLVPGPIDKGFWYWKASVYEIIDGPQCCSKNAISFHYVKANDMYALDYLIYSLQPYGIVKYPQSLPELLVQHNWNRSNIQKWFTYFYRLIN